MGSSSKDAAAGRTRLDACDDAMVDAGDGEAPSLTRRPAVGDDDARVATRRIRGVADALSVTTRATGAGGDAIASPGPITALVAGSRRERALNGVLNLPRVAPPEWTLGAVTAPPRGGKPSVLFSARGKSGGGEFRDETPRGSFARLKSGARALVAAGRGHGFRAGGR